MNKPSRTTFRARLQEMIHTLRTQIESGELQSGDYLPSENRLGEIFRLSKKSVRTGLEQLVADNLIRKIPRVGNQIIGPAASTSSVNTIRVGYYASLNTDAAMDQMIEQFQQRYPNIRVQGIELPFEDYYKTTSQYVQHQMIDVVTLSHSDYLKYKENDQLDLFTPLQIHPQTFSTLNRAFEHKGDIYAEPFVFSPVILCYNKDHFRQLGLPEPDRGWTWHKLSELLMRIKDNSNHFGFYFHLMSDNRWPIFLLQSEASFHRNENGELCADSHAYDGLSLCRDLIYNQGFPFYISEKDEDTDALFIEQKISMMMTTYFGLNHLQNVPFEYDIAPLPAYKNDSTLLLATGAAVSAQSDRLDAARAFVDYLISEEGQSVIRQHTLSIPANQRISEQTVRPELSAPARYHMYRHITHTFRLHSDLNLSTSDLSAIRDRLKFFWSNIEQTMACKSLTY
ncbi:extracellular solute-binding protein [Marinicrinis lubricantis]|uniref:Extracellular solute-binding protein n=1 Tax=Marinicrinis lubricantis TaxID=2086470 RepID=A0ABW1IRQ2_9BACL